MAQQIPFTVLHIPHDSDVIPADIRPTFLLSEEELEREILTMTDHYTAELFDLGADTQRIVYPVSRLVLDPERFLDDTQEVMASRGFGVIYTKTSTGKNLCNVPSERERQELVNRYYIPHHTALTLAVDSVLVEHNFCLLIDCHSFPSHPLSFELDQTPGRPQICIGTDSVHTPDWLAESVGNQFRASNFSVKFNQPYAGTMVPSKYYHVNPSVLSVMIEVNRDLYMNETSGQKRATFAHFAQQLQAILRNVCKIAAIHNGLGNYFPRMKQSTI
jgi:N-formylglutamate amidohydrolase